MSGRHVVRCTGRRPGAVHAAIAGVIAILWFAGCAPAAVEVSPYQTALEAYYGDLQSSDRTFAASSAAVSEAIRADPTQTAAHVLHAQILLDRYRQTPEPGVRGRLVAALQTADATLNAGEMPLDWVRPRIYGILGDLMLVEALELDPFSADATAGEDWMRPWRSASLARGASRFYLLALTTGEATAMDTGDDLPPQTEGHVRELQHATEGFLQARLAELNALDEIDPGALLTGESSHRWVDAWRRAVVREVRGVAVEGGSPSEILERDRLSQIEATMRRLDPRHHQQLGSIFFRSALEAQRDACVDPVSSTEEPATEDIFATYRLVLLDAAVHREIAAALQAEGEDTTSLQLATDWMQYDSLRLAFTQPDSICLAF